MNELRSAWHSPTISLNRPSSRHRSKQIHRMVKPQTGQVAIADGKNLHIPNKPPEDCPRVDDTRAFACPFWRVNPSGNTDCLILKLSRPRDVKQHLQRRHFHSTPPCPKCKSQFSSMDAFGNHIRSDQCTLVQVDSHFYSQSVPPELQDELKKPAKKSLDQEAQWYAIWSLLFPKLPPPETPYLDTVLEEAVGVVQTFWDQQGDDFSERFLEENPDCQMNAEHVRSLLSGFLGHIKTRLHKEGTRVVRSSEGSNKVMDMGFLKDFSTLDGGIYGDGTVTATEERGDQQLFSYTQDPHLEDSASEGSRPFSHNNMPIDWFDTKPDAWPEFSSLEFFEEPGAGMDCPPCIKEECVDLWTGP